jgi:hypothetical protein
MVWVTLHGGDRVCERRIIGMWSALEVCVEGVFILHVPRRPNQLPNVSVRTAELMTLSEEERWRTVWNQAVNDLRGYTVDRCGTIFGKLGINSDSEAVRGPSSEGIHIDSAAVRVAFSSA